MLPTPPARTRTMVSVVVEEAIISITNPSFASWNVDSSCNRGFHHINFTNANLKAAASGLRPSKLRYPSAA